MMTHGRNRVCGVVSVWIVASIAVSFLLSWALMAPPVETIGEMSG
jgi:hypothetical protein